MEEKPRKLTDSEIQQSLTRLKGWKLDKDKATSLPSISKTFRFKDFKAALTFINKVGDIAENYGHHPNILLFMYNVVRLDIFSHSIQALSEWDFELAELIDKIK